jgi:hypothetical protein
MGIASRNARHFLVMLLRWREKTYETRSSPTFSHLAQTLNFQRLMSALRSSQAWPH